MITLTCEGNGATGGGGATAIWTAVMQGSLVILMFMLIYIYILNVFAICWKWGFYMSRFRRGIKRELKWRNKMSRAVRASKAWGRRPRNYVISREKILRNCLKRSLNSFIPLSYWPNYPSTQDITWAFLHNPFSFLFSKHCNIVRYFYDNIFSYIIKYLNFIIKI